MPRNAGTLEKPGAGGRDSLGPAACFTHRLVRGSTGSTLAEDNIHARSDNDRGACESRPVEPFAEKHITIGNRPDDLGILHRRHDDRRGDAVGGNAANGAKGPKEGHHGGQGQVADGQFDVMDAGELEAAFFVDAS